VRVIKGCKSQKYKIKGAKKTKNILKKVLCIMLIMAFTIISIPLSFHADNNDVVYCNVIASTFGSEFASNYSQALDIITAFHENLPANRAGEVIYPNEFGGLYINKNGELVVLLVENHYNSIANVSMSAFEAEHVNFRTVVFSYNELREAFNFMDYFIPNAVGNAAAANVDGISFDIKSNLILVSLAIYNEDKISLFMEMVFDAPFLVFHKSPGIPTHGCELASLLSHESVSKYLDDVIAPLSSVTVRPGDPVFLRNASGTIVRSGSFGYRAVINIAGRGEQLGFVTSAHLGNNALGRMIRTGDRIYNINGHHVGTVQIAHRDSIDAAFVVLAPGVAGSNLTGRGAVLGRILPAPIGAPVILDGQHGRNRPGTVIANWSGNTGTGWTSGARASYTRHDGDSGGIVYSWVSASDNGVVGIHAAGWGTDGFADGGNALFTRANMHRTLIGHQLYPR